MFSIKIDFSDFTSLIQLPDQVKGILNSAGEEMAKQAFAHTVDEANKALHTRKDMYIQALSISKDDDAWLLVLDSSARWIEDGKAAVTKAQLLNSPKAKTGKNGKYLVIPFKHDKGTASSTLTQTVMNAMSQQGLPFADIEKGHDGKPKTGLLHKFNIMDAPTKTNDGPGMGSGSVGEVRQGNTGVPFLQGVRVYQKQGRDKTGQPKTERFIATFRTVSENGKARWDTPSLEGMNFLDNTFDWILNEFDSIWSKKIMDQITTKLDG